MGLQKDDILDELADEGNVAQFVAYRPAADMSPVQSRSRLIDLASDHRFASTGDGLEALLRASSGGRINVRSYEPGNPRSREFVYGIDDVEAAVGHVARLSAAGLHTIANETVDVHDGGVSGVAQGDLIEFAPDDTPRCVEKEGTASLPFDLGMTLLQTVYGFRPDLNRSDDRVEFSIHPRGCGTRRERTLRWEREKMGPTIAQAAMKWPNRFSRMIGDKAYGLLMADLLGQAVPRTSVIGRRVAPFDFGSDTGSSETWLRTCPAIPEPGLFTTAHGWIDPFLLMSTEDPEGDRIAAVIAQAAVPAVHSGAAIVGPGGLIVEGRRGSGDRLMLGLDRPESLPYSVVVAVERTVAALASTLGPVRIEWVHDGERLWVVQLHRGATATSIDVIVPGEAARWIRFDVGDGLEALRCLLGTLPPGTGLEFVGEVGLTSHLADLVRKAEVPTRCGSGSPTP